MLSVVCIGVYSVRCFLVEASGMFHPLLLYPVISYDIGLAMS